jgi:hypothetical protein
MSRSQIFVDGHQVDTAGSDTECIAAQGAGVRVFITSIVITNTSATDTFVQIKCGGSVRMTLPVPANSGVAHSLSSPLQGIHNKNWSFQSGAALSTIYCTLVGYAENL